MIILFPSLNFKCFMIFFIYNRIYHFNHFEVYSSLALSTFTLCNCHRCSSELHHPKLALCPLNRTPHNDTFCCRFFHVCSRICMFTFMAFSLFLCCGRPTTGSDNCSRLRILLFVHFNSLFYFVGSNLIFLFQIVTTLCQHYLLTSILTSLF